MMMVGFFMHRILLTNDDGIHSEGLTQVEAALREVGDVYVVAPASEMSGASHSLTLARPLRIRKIDERHWTVDGTPTDCVTLALHKILPAGALEATIFGVPGLAFSLVTREQYDFTHAAAFAAQVVRRVLAEGLPEGTLLNINLPPGEIRGVRVTRQGVKNARPIISEHIDPRGKAYYWIGEEYFDGECAEDTDFYAVRHGFVSVTPMRSDMTHYQEMAALADWNTVA